MSEKINSAPASRPFLYISLPSLHQYIVKLPDFMIRTWTRARQWFNFFFSELGYSLLEFNSRNILQRLTNWTRWKKREEVLSGANSLFNWRFRCRRNHAKALYFLKPKVKENIIKKIYSYWTVSQQSLAFVFFERCRLS